MTAFKLSGFCENITYRKINSSTQFDVLNMDDYPNDPDSGSIDSMLLLYWPHTPSPPGSSVDDLDPADVLANWADPLLDHAPWSCSSFGLTLDDEHQAEVSLGILLDDDTFLVDSIYDD
jgi:hypothetical protein